MGLLGGLAIGGAAVIAVAAVSFICDDLSEREIRRQNRMRDEYNQYERRRKQEYYDTCAYYENARRNAHEEYEIEIERYRQELIRKRKIENKGIFDNRIDMLKTQRREKEKLLKECIELIKICESSMGKQQNTYLRFKSIKTTIISLEEASYKLEAYLEYLDQYKEKFSDEFEDSGDILEPFSMTLPKGYPYEGQLLYLDPSKFVNGGYVFDELGFVRIDQSDESLLSSNIELSECPFMVTKGKNGRYYLSHVKGLLKQSIGGTIGLDMQVREIRNNSLVLSFMQHEYIWIILDKKNLLNQRRKTPKDSNLHVYVTEYDYALKKAIRVSERVGDGLSITMFDSIPMILSDKDKRDFFAYLNKNDLLDFEDEWRIAPIWDENKELVTGIIMQIANEYAFKAVFEEFSDNRLVLKYCGLLDKKDFVSFDDVFITTNVTVENYTPEQISENPEEYEELFAECQKLQLYLVSEFITQNRMMVNSPMNVYLTQWTEVTNRLIQLMSEGRHISLSVCEYENIKVFGEIYTYFYIDKDNEKAVRNYLEKEEREGRFKYYIQFSEYERIFCKIESNEEQIVIKMKRKVDSQDLLERDFHLELYSLANPYAEKQHVVALDSFREGRVVNSELKNAIINISGEKYQDNGMRITEFFNSQIMENDAQMDAVIRAFAEQKFFMIQGPPGTGKTTVIKEIILQQLKQAEFSKILVVSQANVAVDNVLRGIVKILEKTHFIDSKQIVRCGDIEKIADDLSSYSFESKFDGYRDSVKNTIITDQKTEGIRNRWLEIIDNKENADVVGECLLGCFQIIGATCVGLENRHYGLSNVEFDLVIIDEAGKALPGELLIPMNRAKKVIIIGDHKQLPPVINPALYKDGAVDYDDVVEEENRIDFLNRSFFQRLYEECPETMKGMLKTQFRMPPVIADLVNMFYDGQLMTGDNCYMKEPIFMGNNLILVDMKNEKDYMEKQDKFDNGKKSSPYNEKEAEAIQKIIIRIRAFYSGRIVIITPYKKQKKILIGALKKAEISDNVWVNTIDAFQGDEENIVIFCTTRAKHPTDYFSDSARLNVAFSRAKNTLIILGNSRYFKKYGNDHILHRISNYLEENACCIDYNAFISEETDLMYNDSYLHPEYKEQDVGSIKADFASFLVKTTPEPEKDEIKYCKNCGDKLGDGESVLCHKCLLKTAYSNCKSCKKTISYSLYDRFVVGKEIPQFCYECEPVEIGICEVCGQAILEKRSIVEKEGYIRPATHIQCEGAKWKTIICKNCGESFDLSYHDKKYFEYKGYPAPSNCKDCRNAKKNYVPVGTCEVCGKTIEERGDVIRKIGYVPPHKHQDCETWKTCRCNNCGNAFDITYRDKKYFESKGYDIPCNCEECRKAKKTFVPVGFCQICGKPVMQRGDSIRKYGMKKIEYHKECTNEVYQYRNCRICGDIFPITMGEKLFYDKKGYDLPWKCKDCR